MSSDRPPFSADFCLETLQISSTSVERVEECAGSNEGSDLLHQYGVETHNLDPQLTGVPWLLFDNVKVNISKLIKYSDSGVLDGQLDRWDE